MNQPIRFQIEVIISPETVKDIHRILFSNEEREQRRFEVAQRARYGPEKPPADESSLIDTRQAAQLLKCSTRTIFKMQTEGEMPKPIRIGRAVRWARAEFMAWIDAGCPAASDWKYEPTSR